MNQLKNISKYMLTFIFTFTFIYQMRAQELLTPEDAVAFAVSKNFDIVIAKNEADIARINNNRGEAGMLPIIDITTGDAFNLNNINQKFTTGQNVVKNWVPVNSFNASAQLNWTVFDGLKMFATKRRLEALQSQSEIQLKEQIQNSIGDVLTAYYDVVRQVQQLKAYDSTIRLYDERVSLSQRKFDVGYSDKTPLLQAQVDYAQQKINIVKQQSLVEEAKANLNKIIGRAPEIVFNVIDSISINYEPSLQDVKDTALQQNYSILAAMKDIDIAKFERKEINSQRLPRINFDAGYGFTQNNSKAGLQLFNRSYGPLLGVNATIPIYQGGVVKKRLEANAVNIGIQQLQVEQLKNDVSTQVLVAYRNYQYAKQVMDLNLEAIKAANENVTISMERYRLSEATSLETREAQNSYQEALYDLILSRYNAKIAEIQLKKLTNGLIK
ncbi:MAG: outer rane efflux protein [Bacteroidota bacterium]|nr:outer rane efflux protein [Bacteroidota bacterium]